MVFPVPVLPINKQGYPFLTKIDRTWLWRIESAVGMKISWKDLTSLGTVYSGPCFHIVQSFLSQSKKVSKIESSSLGKQLAENHLATISFAASSFTISLTLLSKIFLPISSNMTPQLQARDIINKAAISPLSLSYKLNLSAFTCITYPSSLAASILAYSFSLSRSKNSRTSFFVFLLHIKHSKILKKLKANQNWVTKKTYFTFPPYTNLIIGANKHSIRYLKNLEWVLVW